MKWLKTDASNVQPDVMDKDYEGKVALMDWCKELIDRFGKQHGIGFCDHYSTARLE